MARTAKKEKALTPEERLAQALMPDVEQPYWVPENWCWVWHNSILDISGGSQPDKSLFAPEPKAGYTQLYQTRDYGEHPIPVFIPDKYATKTTVEGDILLARYGGSLGKVFKARAGAYNVALAKVIILHNDAINKELLYYYYLSHFYQDFCVRAAYGRSAQAGFNRDDLAGLMFPLPPFAEQQRIVDRIESLFAKLDEAKEKAQSVVDGFENRKAAILHKAFTGELTAGWRKKNGYSSTQWKLTMLKDCSCSIGDGLHGTPAFDENGDYYFVNGNNFSGTQIEIKPDTKAVSFDEFVKHKIELFPSTTVFVSINGTLGKTAFYNSEPIILGKSACYVNVNEKLSKFFLRYYFTSKEFIVYANAMATGSTIKNLGLKAMRNMTLNLPSIPEQDEIVRILDNMLNAMQKSKESAEQVIDQIDTMKKAILARAFRGELGTNDPTEESAEEMLRI